MSQCHIVKGGKSGAVHVVYAAYRDHLRLRPLRSHPSADDKLVGDQDIAHVGV